MMRMWMRSYPITNRLLALQHEIAGTSELRGNRLNLATSQVEKYGLPHPIERKVQVNRIFENLSQRNVKCPERLEQSRALA
jgi:hypothetical protein